MGVGTLLVRAPSRRLAEGQITHISRPTSISYDLAYAEWTSYVAAFAATGWTVKQVSVADECPDCVFVEDAVVMFGSMAVLTSPGTPSREPEITDVAHVVQQLPGITVRSISKPGTLDGGDVLKIGKDVYVGRGGRTNAEGIRQLRDMIAPLGYTLHPVPVTKALHLSKYNIHPRALT